MAAEQDNAAVVRRFWDRVWNNGELLAIEELVDDDFTNFGIRRPGGHAALRHIVTAWRTAFPDLHIQVQEEIACGDTVVHRVLARGTHLGEFPPGIGPGRVLDAMPPTGRSFEADQIHIHQVTGGKITGHAAHPERPAHAQPARPAARHRTGQRGSLAHPADPRVRAARPEARSCGTSRGTEPTRGHGPSPQAGRGRRGPAQRLPPFCPR